MEKIKIFVVDRERKIREVMVDKNSWGKGGIFSTRIDRKPVPIKHGEAFTEGIWSGFETREEAELAAKKKKVFVVDAKLDVFPAYVRLEDWENENSRAVVEKEDGQKITVMKYGWAGDETNPFVGFDTEAEARYFVEAVQSEQTKR